MAEENRLFLGIFLVSLSALMLEVSLIRVFSITKWYHFAFMVVSIALLGYGASGSFLSIARNWMQERPGKLLAVFSLLLSISIVASFALTNFIPFDPFKLTMDWTQLLFIGLHYLFLAVPFFCAGNCIAIALTTKAKEVNRIYFSDLSGAAIGSIGVLGASLLLPTPQVIVLAALIAGLSAMVFASAEYKKVKPINLIWLVLVLLLLFNPLDFMQPKSSPYKGLNNALRYPEAKIVSSEWNSYSKVDVVESKGIRYAPGLSYQFRGEIPKQFGLSVDDGSIQSITATEKKEELRFVEFLPNSVAYRLGKRNKVLLLGFNDPALKTAIYFGAEKITLTEMNPLIVKAFKEYGKGKEKIKVELSEERAYAKKSKEEFDLIELALKENIFESSLYGMTENYSLTVEAFQDYLNRLSENGVVSTTRWMSFPPKESPKLTALALEALKRNGTKKPENHLALFRGIQAFTLLVKKTEFTEKEIEGIKRLCEEKKFDLVYLPGIKESEANRFNKFKEAYYFKAVQAVLKEDRKQLENYLFEVRAVNDDRPFFFHFFKWNKLAELYESMGEKWEPFFEGGFLVLAIFVQAIVLSILLIFLPLYFFKRNKTELKEKKIIAFFFLIGLSYMFVEVSLMQKFILFLGQPVYAVSVVIFGLLLFSGFGSYFSQRIEAKEVKEKLKQVIPGIIVLLVAALLSLPSLFNFFFELDILFRYGAAVLMLALPGFLMGIPFPLGMKKANQLDNNLMPWCWCSNGCASVIGAVLALLLAISFGFPFVLAAAGVLYLLALGVVLRLRD